MTAGFIQFSIAGGAVRDSSLTFTGGASDAAQDENSVLFGGKASYEIALKIKKYVEDFMEAPSSVASSNASVADEIVKLKGLMDQRIISPEEFETIKRQLLGI